MQKLLLISTFRKARTGIVSDNHADDEHLNQKTQTRFTSPGSEKTFGPYTWLYSQTVFHAHRLRFCETSAMLTERKKLSGVMRVT
jgi:hypothetical protein